MGNNWLTYYDTVEPLNSYIDSGVIDTTAISPAMLATTTNQANGDVTGISNGTNFGPMFAMSTLSLIPVFTLFLFFNRYLMDGVTAGSVKG